MHQSLSCADHAKLSINLANDELIIEYSAPHIDRHAVFIALGAENLPGSAVLPFADGYEGSAVFLPFQAALFCCARANSERFGRTWKTTQWSARNANPEHFKSESEPGRVIFKIPLNYFANSEKIRIVAYAKDLAGNNGWGWFFGCSDAAVRGGISDKTIPHFHEIDRKKSEITRKSRLESGDTKPRIYQLFVRLFGNTNETRKFCGTRDENGVGKFNDISDDALASIQKMGFTHIWLTGVLRQATAADYSDIGLPADDPDILKGLAGSPYAIKDYFDLCPDYAENPANRHDEFRALLDRIHSAGMRALIDLVPNHVARSYDSTIQPDQNFGANDDHTQFFDPKNNFFYLANGEDGPPLRLPIDTNNPVTKTLDCDGLFDGEKEFGRVTGNNCASWQPGLSDWYETIKLNYGYNFANGERAFPHGERGDQSDASIPDTWQKIDAILEHWQNAGVDGFRCDMAHMIPPEFWHWAIFRARQRNATAFFIAEAYNNDPAKVASANPIVAAMDDTRIALLDAGFNAIYADPLYKTLKRIYDGGGWANDIDDTIQNESEFVFQNALYYAENHDEVRIAAHDEWGGCGMNAGRSLTAILFGLSRAPSLIYNGQEIGEPAADAAGFGKANGRTTIYDYWSMPEFVKWVNDHRYDGGKLSDEQKELRKFYRKLVSLTGQPAFRDGAFFPLNFANRDQPKFGRIDGETVSGHWLYAFLRHDSESGQRFLVIANLHREHRFENARIFLPKGAFDFLSVSGETDLHFHERLAEPHEFSIPSKEVAVSGIQIPSLEPLNARYLEIKTDS